MGIDFGQEANWQFELNEAIKHTLNDYNSESNFRILVKKILTKAN